MKKQLAVRKETQSASLPKSKEQLGLIEILSDFYVGEYFDVDTNKFESAVLEIDTKALKSSKGSQKYAVGVHLALTTGEPKFEDNNLELNISLYRMSKGTVDPEKSQRMSNLGQVPLDAIVWVTKKWTEYRKLIPTIAQKRANGWKGLGQVYIKHLPEKSKIRKMALNAWTRAQEAVITTESAPQDGTTAQDIIAEQ